VSRSTPRAEILPLFATPGVRREACIGKPVLGVASLLVPLTVPAPPHYVRRDNAAIRLAKSGAEVGPLKFAVQGVLYLVDTPAENGAFTCVPGFHRVIDDWLAELGNGAGSPAKQDYLKMRGPSGQGLTRVGARAGDLVIWQTTLPHYSAGGQQPRRTALGVASLLV
jgi:hypothetical protein